MARISKKQKGNAMNQDVTLEKFLFRSDSRQMVAGEFINYRTVGRDADVVKLVAEIKEKSGRDDGMFTLYYATRKVYTINLHFDWHPQAPKSYRALEDWWNMVQNGEAEEELYMFYIENVHNIVGQEWQAALESAQFIWKPSEEGWADEVDENGNPIEGVDPN